MIQFYAQVYYDDFIKYCKVMDCNNTLSTIELAKYYLQDIGTSCIKTEYNMKNMTHNYTKYTYIPIQNGWNIVYNLSTDKMKNKLKMYEPELKIYVKTK